MSMSAVYVSVLEYALLDEDLKYHLGHQFEDMIVEASFSTMDVIEDFVHEFNPHLGNCFTFNHHTSNQTFTMSRAGPNYGELVGLLLKLSIFGSRILVIHTVGSGVVLGHNTNIKTCPG